jgi:hypothetical protein
MLKTLFHDLKYTIILTAIGILFFVLVPGSGAERESPSGVYVAAAVIEALLGYGYVRVTRSRFFKDRGYLKFLLYALGFSLPIIVYYAGNDVLSKAAGSQFWFIVAVTLFTMWPFLRERYRQGKYKEEAANVESYSKGFVLAAAILVGLFGPIFLILWLFTTCA